MRNILGAFLVFAGLIAMGGSAGDCDGKCMEQANTLGEMIMYASMGLALLISGTFVALIEKK